MAGSDSSAPTVKKGKTGQFMKQGQTAGQFGNDPTVSPMGKVANPPRDLSA